MSAGNSATSASTVSFNVSTVHTIVGNYTRCGMSERIQDYLKPCGEASDLQRGEACDLQWQPLS
jgi:hypothetical protein